MEKLMIEATKSSPSICFDPKANFLEIKGESYPENSATFYKPLFAMLDLYLSSAPLRDETFEVNLEIVYFNSISSKILMNFFEALDGAAENGKKIVVNWRYHEENDTALECGEEFMEGISAVAFNLVMIDMVK
ncbi:MAG: DUF1987 domain-containing protein [Deltaproteobacteria bacterium]|nr:DUF1987 domain-containing protein [Deltaproteobacteria bacterium]